jgi:hypothetical protein
MDTFASIKNMLWKQGIKLEAGLNWLWTQSSDEAER